MNRPDLHKIPGISMEGDEPVFNEPWEAQAFALVLQLYEKGRFTWSEWADALGNVIKENDAATPYYELWLIALESILSQKALISDEEICNRQKEWKAALRSTPHGMPVELRNANLVCK